MNRDTSTVMAVAGVLVLALFGTAGVLFITPGPESLQRLGLLFALLGTGLAAFVGMLKAAEAAVNTNGKLDARIEAGVHRANAARRRGDEPWTPDEVERASDGDIQARIERYVEGE